MPRFIRSRVFGCTYRSILEIIISRLEEHLYRRLERLESKIAMHELPQVESEWHSTCKTMRKPQRGVKSDLPIGRPSVILLGARLRSDQRYCCTLIERLVGVIRTRIGEILQSSQANTVRKK